MVLVDGAEAPREVPTTAQNVEEFLADIGAPLEFTDTVLPARTTPLVAGTRVEVTRVRITEETQTVKVDPPVEATEDPELAKAEGSAGEGGAAELAGALAWRLRRLDAIRRAASELFARPRLGYERFAHGRPSGLRVRRKSRFRLPLHELDPAPGKLVANLPYQVATPLGAESLGGLPTVRPIERPAEVTP